MPQQNDAINKAYQSIFTALNGYKKTVSDTYRGGILELAQRLEKNTVFDAGTQVKGDILESVKNNTGDLVNWRSDTRLQTIRDIEIVMNQFPDLELARNTVLEAMCDGDTVNGGMKLNITSKDATIDAETLVAKLERKYRVKYNLRNTALGDTLSHGEYYVMIKKVSDILNYAYDHPNEITESVSLLESVKPKEENTKRKTNSDLTALYESANKILQTGTESDLSINAKGVVDHILGSIKIHSSFENMMIDQYGVEGLEYLAKDSGYRKNQSNNLFENIVDGYTSFGDLDEKDTAAFDKIKGCYIKWLPATQMVPIRMGSVLVGFYIVYYGNTNLATKSNFANGVVDITQINEVSTDQDFMNRISQLLVQNLNLKFVQKNLDLVNEIAAVLIETQFRKKEVEFTFVPKEDVVSFKINVDTDGNGTSMFARSLFNARLYTMLMMNNIINILNNRPSRTYKIKRDPRTNNISGVIQRFKEKIYTKRVGVDDVWSYSGAMNKIGSPNDMVIPVDQDGTPPFTKEYDEGATIQLNTDLMEMIKKDAISLSGVPNAIINQQDEIEYSKLAQMAQLKLLDFVKSLKIDINESITLLYRKLFMMEFDMTEEQADAISIMIPDVRSNDITILSEMLNTFSSIFEQLQSVLLTTDEATTAEGKPSTAVKNLKYELMKMMVPSLDYAEIERILKVVGIAKVEDDLNDQRRSISDFSDEDIENEIENQQG